jgi:hypothetical protein
MSHLLLHDKAAKFDIKKLIALILTVSTNPFEPRI